LTERARPWTRPLLALLLLGLAGCVTTPVAGPSGVYAWPIGNAPVIDNGTPYSDALGCLGETIARDRTTTALPRLAVGDILDYTGKYDEDAGAKVTQGAALMAVSAIGKLGLPMVERLDSRITETELRFANNNLIGDGGAIRQIRAASIPGSQYFLVGGITELNYNISSTAADVYFWQAGIGGQLYVLNVALDLRLVRTETLEVVDVVSYQKQILGREVRAGIFEFFDGNLFDLSVSDRALEPMQLAVRAMVERAVGEMARRLFDLPGEACAPSLADEATHGVAAPSSNQGYLP
jgi:curli production assembly/transport component CsgG/holdfast attachment protein HfaB